MIKLNHIYLYEPFPKDLFTFTIMFVLNYI